MRKTWYRFYGAIVYTPFDSSGFNLLSVIQMKFRCWHKQYRLLVDRVDREEIKVPQHRYKDDVLGPVNNSNTKHGR